MNTPIAPPLARRGDAAVRWLLVTTSRCSPATASFEEHAAADPRAPFHWWIPSDAKGQATQVRWLDHVVLPDGLSDNPLAIHVACHAEIICLAGKYHSSRAMTLGAATLEDCAAERLQTLLEARAEQLHLSLPTCLLSLEDLGAPAHVGDAVHAVVAKLRSSQRYYRPPNPFLVEGPIRNPADGRKLLAALGYTVTASKDGVPSLGDWYALDQVALLAFQRHVGIEPTGHFDELTSAALYEADWTRRAGPSAALTHSAPDHAGRTI